MCLLSFANDLGDDLHRLSHSKKKKKNKREIRDIQVVNINFHRQ